MQFDKKTWGEYIPSPGDTIQDAIDAASSANALITANDLQRYEDALAELSAKIELVVPMTSAASPIRFRGTFAVVPTDLQDLQDGDYVFVAEG